jgi:hypothetical protein
MKQHVLGTKDHEGFMKSAGIVPARHEVAYG